MRRGNRKRTIVKKVCFDKNEYEYIMEKIEISPFNNFQNFARILLITGEVHVTDYHELEQLNYKVNRIGNNINQIAKLAHQFQEISTLDIENLQKQVSEIEQMLSEQLKKEKLKERNL